jgi:valyl-tRNA synthetase
LKYFYPTSVLETGYDILFFWVARMIMMGIEFTGKAPFHTVYLHGLVRDDQGRKMSKTIGNVIDPLEVMDKYGTDALRFTLLVGSTPGQDVNLSLEKVAANRNFANKLWNASRFVFGALAAAPKEMKGELEWTLADSWIWARTKQLTATANRLFESNQYGETGRQIYEFFWNEFADWYIEIAKLQLVESGDRAFKTADLLVRVLDVSLRLLHPFTPFVTEELWTRLKETALSHSPNINPEKQGNWPPGLIVAPWPEPIALEGWEEGILSDFIIFQDLVRAIRNLRAEKGIKPGQKIAAHFVSQECFDLLNQQKSALTSLAQLDPAQLSISSSAIENPDKAISLVAGPVEVYFPLSGLTDPAEERVRLERELADIRAQIQRLEGLLASDFSSKAPPAVVEKEQARLQGFKTMASSLEEQLKAM